MQNVIGIVCAMPEELAGFVGIARDIVNPGDGYIQMTIGDCNATVACHGLGKVYAAMAATTLLERFKCTALVSAGTAGGLANVAPLDVLIGHRLIQHDYGRTRGAGQIELYKPGIPPLPEYHGKNFAIQLPERLRSRIESGLTELDYVRFGTFASGDTFINDDMTRQRLLQLGANAVDMESAAVAQVAEFAGIPWLVAKGISDDASGNSHEDFLTGLRTAANRSATVISRLAGLLSQMNAN